MSPAAKDIYTNTAYGSVTESAAGTITFNEIQSGVSLFEKVAWLINKVEYHLTPGNVNLLVDEADYIKCGVCVSNLLTDFNLGDSALVDFLFLCQANFGSAASGMLYTTPFTKDFGDMPGGGLLIPPNPLFVVTQGISMASAVTLAVRIFFTYVHLKPEEYWELVESRRIIT